MRKTFYTVRLGGRLYIKTQLYALYQQTTENIESAYWYVDEGKAARIANKYHGEVVPIYLDTEKHNKNDEEIEDLYAQILKLQKENKFLKEQIKILKDRDENS